MEPKTHFIGIRISDADKHKLDALRAGRSLSHTIRELISKKAVEGRKRPMRLSRNIKGE